MNPNIISLFYSKYSSKCKKILEMVSEIPDIKTVCIDNKNIRKKILNDKKININYVPCILLIFPNGYVEKYEGEHSYRFVEEMVFKIRQQQTPQQQAQQQQAQAQQQQAQAQQQTPQQQAQPQEQPQAQQQQEQPQAQQQAHNNYTSIENLDYENNDIENFSTSSDSQHQQKNFLNSKKKLNVVQERIDTTSKKEMSGGGDLLNIAKKMEKERSSIISKDTQPQP